LQFSHKILAWDKIHTFFTILQCNFKLHVTALDDGHNQRNTKANMHAGILKFSSSG